MKNNKHILKLIIFIAVFGCYKSAMFSQGTISLNPNIQDNKPLNFNIGLSYTNSIPLHDYSGDLMNSPQGFNINAGIKPQDFPITLGLNIECLFLKDNFIRKSNVSGIYPDGWTSGLSFPTGYVDYNGLTNPDDFYHIINSIVPVSLFVRIEPGVKKYIQPYSEFSIGVNSQYLLGIPNIRNEYLIYYEKWEYKSYYLTYFFGLGLGATMNINDIIESPSILSNMKIDIKLKYSKGIRSAYFKRSSIDYNLKETILTKEEAFGQTDFLFYSLGLQYQF